MKKSKLKKLAKKMGHDPNYIDVIRALPGAVRVKKNDKKK